MNLVEQLIFAAAADLVQDFFAFQDATNSIDCNEYAPPIDPPYIVDLAHDFCCMYAPDETEEN